MRRLPAHLLAPLLVGWACALNGCAVNRHVLTNQELACRRAEYLERAASEQRSAIEKIVRRMKRKHNAAAEHPDRPPVFDVLIISGGGDKGAFAAGFLAGWSNVSGPLARPQFDVVTGVSTGAIIAPFAFTDDALADARILKIYQEPQKDWSQPRDWFFFLPGRESFVDAAGLKRDIEREMDRNLVFALAKGASEDRLLAIGTTNLDLGVSQTWDLTEEAHRALSAPPNGRHTFERLHEILRASAAIPAVFPPVVIDDALYVDGGATSNILIIDDLRSTDTPRHLFRKLYPGLPIPLLRYWIIINNRLTPESRIIQPTWVSITEASVDTMIRSAEMGTLRQFAEQVDFVRQTEPDVRIELRFVAIPDTWSPAQTGIFQEENMKALTDIGLHMGLDPASWKSDLAKPAHAQATPLPPPPPSTSIPTTPPCPPGRPK
jgi:hypothetical protein